MVALAQSLDLLLQDSGNQIISTALIQSKLDGESGLHCEDVNSHVSSQGAELQHPAEPQSQRT